MTGTGLAWYDNRRVTITIRGLKPDVVAAIKDVLAVFNVKTQLAYPSVDAGGQARFLKMWPDGNAKMKQDEATKDGQDVWIGEIGFIVRSVRAQ